MNRHFRGAKVTTSKNKTVAALRRDAHGGLHQSLSRAKRPRASFGCWLIGQTRGWGPSTAKKGAQGAGGAAFRRPFFNACAGICV